MADTSQFNVTNYLVPAAGQTHCIAFNGAPFSASPFPIDWRQFRIDNFPFQPQGVIIDNTNSTTPTVVTIQPIGFPITCGAGAVVHMPFPAPNGQTAQITGGGALGDVTNVYFVDYPLIPYVGSNATVGNNVIIAGIGTASALNVTVPQYGPGGLPYRNQPLLAPGQVMYGSIAGAAVSVTLTPAANRCLTRLAISATRDCTLATAGANVITATLNGAQVFKRSVWIPSAAATDAGFLDICDFNVTGAALNGAAGSLVVAIGTALATGSIEVNAIFNDN